MTNGPDLDDRWSPSTNGAEAAAGSDSLAPDVSTLSPAPQATPPPRPERSSADYRLRGLDFGGHRIEHGIRKPPKRGVLRSRRRRILVRWGVVLALVAAVAVLLRMAAMQPFSVSSAAMGPTLQVGDRILVVKSTLLAGTVGRGDIVIFRHPKGFACATVRQASQDLVTRVIGMPGDTIWSAGSAIYVDGHKLREKGWYNPRYGPVGSTPISRRTIAKEHYFVMGDNRSDTCDSRTFGAIPKSSIVGNVVAIVLRHSHPFVHFF